MSNVSIAGHAGWPAYNLFLIVLLLGQLVYDPNPLRPNPNPQKPVLCSRVESNIDTPRFKGEIFGHGDWWKQIRQWLKWSFGHGDWRWINHGFWLWWSWRPVVDVLVIVVFKIGSWSAGEVLDLLFSLYPSFPLCMSIYLSKSCYLCVWKCRIFEI